MLTARGNRSGSDADRAAGYRYECSILQAEFSLTQMLDRPVSGRVFFEQVIRSGDAPSVVAEHWSQLLGSDAAGVGRGGSRLRLLGFLARRFGSVFVLALAQRAERRTAQIADLDAPPAMAADERVHEEVVRGLAARGRARVSGTFRAAVFGANDGLVSNLSLVLGVVGGGAPTRRWSHQRPPRRGARSGNNGSNRAHSASVKSCPIMHQRRLPRQSPKIRETRPSPLMVAVGTRGGP